MDWNLKSLYGTQPSKTVWLTIFRAGPWHKVSAVAWNSLSEMWAHALGNGSFPRSLCGGVQHEIPARWDLGESRKSMLPSLTPPRTCASQHRYGERMPTYRGAPSLRNQRQLPKTAAVLSTCRSPLICTTLFFLPVCRVAGWELWGPNIILWKSLKGWSICTALQDLQKAPINKNSSKPIVQFKSYRN